MVITDSRRGPKSGNNVDTIGTYNPKLGQIEIDGPKAKEWIGKGVQVSDTVHNMLVSKKIIEGKKVNALPKKSPIVDEEAIKKQQEEEAAAKQAAEEAAAAESAEAEAPAEAPAEEAPAETPEEEKKEA